MNSKGYLGGIITAFVIIVGLIIMAMCLERIPAGYVGVVYKPSIGIAEETLNPGWHFISPMDKVTEYSIGIEQSYLTATEDGDSKGDDSFSAPSSDGKGLQMELTFTYRYDAEKVADTFSRFKGRSGKDLLNTFIKPNVISWTKEVTAKYPVTDILGEKRAELNTQLGEYLAQKFKPYGIIIENASLINIEVDDETRASITKKVTAQQELELAKIASDDEYLDEGNYIKSFNTEDVLQTVLYVNNINITTITTIYFLHIISLYHYIVKIK